MNTPNETGHEIFIAGLRNGKSGRALIKRRLGRIENYPEVRADLKDITSTFLCAPSAT